MRGQQPVAVRVIPARGLVGTRWTLPLTPQPASYFGVILEVWVFLAQVQPLTCSMTLGKSLSFSVGLGDVRAFLLLPLLSGATP